MLYNYCCTVANIKAGLKTKRLSVNCVSNNFTKRVLRKLIAEGYIRGFSVSKKNLYKLSILLKYDENFNPVIRDISVVSTSGNRVYFNSREILKAYSKGENYIISTNKGLFTVNELVYNKLNIGGEVILSISFY